MCTIIVVCFYGFGLLNTKKGKQILTFGKEIFKNKDESNHFGFCPRTTLTVNRIIIWWMYVTITYKCVRQNQSIIVDVCNAFSWRLPPHCIGCWRTKNFVHFCEYFFIHIHEFRVCIYVCLKTWGNSQNSLLRFPFCVMWFVSSFTLFLLFPRESTKKDEL